MLESFKDTTMRMILEYLADFRDRRTKALCSDKHCRDRLHATRLFVWADYLPTCVSLCLGQAHSPVYRAGKEHHIRLYES